VYLDPGTIFAITVALAGACFVMVVGLRRSMELEQVIRSKNKKIIQLEAQLEKEKV